MKAKSWFTNYIKNVIKFVRNLIQKFDKNTAI